MAQGMAIRLAFLKGLRTGIVLVWMLLSLFRWSWEWKYEYGFELELVFQ